MAAVLPRRGLPDLIRPGLKVLFCGINPGMLAAETGHHFAGRGNRFWRVMDLAGFTPRQIEPQDSNDLLGVGCGLTTVVERPTAQEAHILPEEYRAASQGLRLKIAHNQPEVVAFLGKAACAGISARKPVDWGLQPGLIGVSRVWVLPNPSGRNLTFKLDGLVASYRALRDFAFPGEVP